MSRTPISRKYGNSVKLIAGLMLGSALLLQGCTSLPTPDQSAQQIKIPASMTLVESVEKTGDDIVIPYKKYVLDNGLTVVLHEDHSDPLVHVDVTYHVGSAREEIGKSGFAHFFEHMMFQGSENVGDEQHFKIVSESGGTLNGSTNTDRTNYFETVPANQLEKVLWLEADRMGFLLPSVTQEKFEVQRATVKNERGQNYDNRPYGLLRERVNAALYPYGHPYSWLTIGYIEDLDRVNVNDLKKFFLRWYGPNNATLTIGGDIDEEQTLAWVEKYYGSIPRGPEVEDPVAPPVVLDKDRYISMEDNVSLPLLYMSWPTVTARHPDEAPLDVLMDIMGVGETSLLYKNLVKNGLAVQASASHGCSELECTFVVLALPNPAKGSNLADLEKIARDSFAEFETRGVQDDDLERVKAGIVSDMIYGLESVRGKVSQLAAYETFEGNPNYISKDIERYRNVTKDDVVRVYEKYIKGKPAVIMSIVPQGQTALIAAPDSFTPPERVVPEYAETKESDLNYRVAKDNFDRSVQPKAGENPAISLPTMWRETMDNGVEILGAINDETPTTTISIRIKAGHKSDPLDHLGLASLTASMLNEATQKSTKEELSNRLAKLGSSISVDAGDSFTTMTIRSLSENVDETLDIAHEMLLAPAFSQEDFERVKDQTLQGIEFNKKQASSVATDVFRGLLYGPNNAFAYNTLGTAETVAAISLEDVKNFYDQYYAASIGSMIVVSDMPQAKMAKSLAIFEDWQAKPVPVPILGTLPQLEGGILYLVDKPGAAQSEIRIGKRALTYDATGPYYRAGLMNFVLGGAFNSRININLREDKGYTYGAFSYFTGDEDVGRFTAQAGVRSDITDKALIEFYKELNRYGEEGITEQELAFTKSAIGQSDARKYETPRQKVSFLSNILTYDLPDGFIDQQKAILANLTKEEVDDMARRYLTVDEMITVVVGDKATILPGLEALGMPIIELDQDGKPVSNDG